MFRRRLLVQNEGRPLVPSTILGDVWVPVFSVYKHLGGLVCTNASVAPEVANRTLSACHTFMPLARK
eukprot:8052069-Alexandrium_andersonii.AAC.1